MSVKLIYIPLIYMRDHGMYPPTRPTLWYFNWQCDVWDTLTELKIPTIWKAGPRTSNLVDPMKYRESKIIRYSEKKLSRELKKVTHAIVDFPSTPLMEALHHTIPTLCMVPPWDKEYIRDEYKHLIEVTNQPRMNIVKFLQKEGVV